MTDYCISITKKSDMSITVIYHAMSLTISVSLRRVIGLSRWFIMPFLWLVSVSLRRVISLSQWFLMLCLWLYCISITKKCDTSITVIYHLMSLTVLYQYHQDEWYVYHSDLLCYVSEWLLSIILRRVICLWLYCINITKKSDTYITVIYHTMSDYCISITRKCDRSITVIYHDMSLWLLYQYH
jgi:hypothetical protein